jgi:hypothetical protein
VAEPRQIKLPEFYHYFERSVGPFRSVSTLDDHEASRVLDELRADARFMASRRTADSLARRRELEMLARELFIQKGGRPRTETPHYMVIGACAWLETWYANPAHVSIPVGRFDPACVSFSYGDLFPTFGPRVRDGKEYRRRIYTCEEIVDLIGRYGYPQDWNATGEDGPERYIEVHVWDDRPVAEAARSWKDGTASGGSR